MIYKRKNHKELFAVCFLTLSFLMSVTAKAKLCTVPIVVQVSIDPNVLTDANSIQGKLVPEIMHQKFEEAVRDYFEVWWEIDSKHRMPTEITMNLTFEKGDRKDHYFRVELLVTEEWTDVDVNDLPLKTFKLAEEIWQDPVGDKTPETSSENVLAALAEFLQDQFPNDWIRKKSRLLDFMGCAPVAVGAELVSGQSHMLLLPFPHKVKYKAHEHRLFRLLARNRFVGFPPLTVKAQGHWQLCPHLSADALLGIVENAPAGYNSQNYDQALIYLSEEDPFWTSY